MNVVLHYVPLKLMGRRHLTQTGCPFCVPGFQRGIRRTTRAASRSSAGCKGPTTRTSFTFSWKAYDNEDASLDYILELDTTHYYVGALEKIQQSGLQSGTHLFLVIVKDSEGDTDTLPPVKFYVVDTLEAKK